MRAKRVKICLRRRRKIIFNQTNRHIRHYLGRFIKAVGVAPVVHGLQGHRTLAASGKQGMRVEGSIIALYSNLNKNKC